ncbi:MAG TPA: mercuric reductase [Pyrinomonadaceae bacterium]|nr:mercuric reductase [Pyrinomonadaceae bacterium]
MTESNHFEVLIIGGGQAGIPLAHELAKAGKRVALAEEKHLGGSCINFGCTPTKAAIGSAHVAQLARRASEFGIKIPVVEVDFRAVLRRAKEIANEYREGLQKRFAQTDNPKLLSGQAHFVGRESDEFRLVVGDDFVLAEQVVIDTGTRSTIPPVAGLDRASFICAENWLESNELPAHLVMIGGGYIGLEMSQFYRRMGSNVTVIEEAGQVAGHEDEDVASALESVLAAEGIEFCLNTRVKRVETNQGKVEVTVEKENKSSVIEASHLFVATGRTPNTAALGLETVGVKVSERGIVETDERLATNVPGVWAAGDIRGGPMFTHTSWDDYRILLSQLSGDGSRTTNRIVPYAIFTEPELGRVGMTERELRKNGKDVKVARYEMKSNSRAKEFGETEGFIKVLIDTKSNLILGAAVLAAEGAELVHIYGDLMNAAAPYTVVRDAIYIHPTLAEAIQSAVLSV